MTDERFELGVKIVAILAVVIFIFEILLAFGVIRKKEISVSVLDDIEKDVSNSELLKTQDLNYIDLNDYYVEE